MARPFTDVEAARSHLLDVLVMMIQRRGGESPTLADLARQAGMSPANIYRFFESKDALYEALAARWFAPKIAIMEQVIASDAPSRTKLYDFFARRFVLLRENFDDDPLLFQRYCELGEEHRDIIRSYLDLGDHYLAMIVAECMADGHLEGLSIDEAVALINIMLKPFCHPSLLLDLMHSLSEERLSRIVDAILDGLKGAPTVPARLTLAA